MTSLHRILLIFLLLIVCGNIVLYRWLSGQVQESSAAMMVQKAYVVSRLISEAGGRALAAGKLVPLGNVVNEALKDKDLLSVTIKRASGEVILETSASGIPEKLSTFETPLQVNGKQVGTVITRFRLEGDNSRLAARITAAATTEAALLIAAAALLGTAHWQRRRRTPPEADTPPRVEAAPPAVCSQTIAAAQHAGEALQQALDIISAQAEKRRRIVSLTSKSATQADNWSTDCALAAGRSESLITAGQDIITMVLQECRKSAAASPAAETDLATLLLRARAAISACSTSPCIATPNADAVFLELEKGLRHTALPDLLAAQQAAAESAALLTAFDGLFTAMTTHAAALGVGCEELYESARLLGDEQADTAESPREDGRAEQLQALAEAHADRILALQEQMPLAAELRQQLEAGLQSTALRIRLAGGVLEDAATAALQGGSILTRMQAAAGQQRLAAAETATALAAAVDALEAMAPTLKQPEQVAASLAIAADTLQMAAAMLRDSARADKGLLSGELRAAADQTADETAAEQLIMQARISIGRLIVTLAPPSEERAG